MRICDRCGKGVQVGMNVSHSHVRTKKRSHPNLHSFKISEGNTTARLQFCTKCLRIVKKEQREKVAKTSRTKEEIKIQTDSTIPDQEKAASEKSKPAPTQKDLESVKEELAKVIK